jgi:hypothetical protein
MSSRRGRLLIAVCAGAYAAGVLVSACSSPRPSKPPPAAQASPALWGDMKPVVSVKELMHDFIDPASDYIFDSVGTVVTRQGEEERLPRSDEDWAKLRMGAVMIAEGVYLLKVPRPFAPPGDNNNSSGPDPEELSPAQIEAKLQQDPVLWNAKIEALRNVGLEVMEIVKTKNAKELWDAAENLDEACENCHIEYWYPGDKALLNRLDRHLQEIYGKGAPKPTAQPR